MSAGPNELAYLGQLREVYAHFGVPMPLVLPRATATLLDSAAHRFLERYGLPLEALQPQDESGLNQLLEAQLPPAVEAAFHGRARIVGQHAALVDARAGARPHARGRGALDARQDGARSADPARQVIHAAKRRDETLRRQFVRARALTFPDGHPQERTLGFVWFLNRYGPALVDVLDRALPLDVGRHCAADACERARRPWPPVARPRRDPRAPRRRAPPVLRWLLGVPAVRARRAVGGSPATTTSGSRASSTPGSQARPSAPSRASSRARSSCASGRR